MKILKKSKIYFSIHLFFKGIKQIRFGGSQLKFKLLCHNWEMHKLLKKEYNRKTFMHTLRDMGRVWNESKGKKYQQILDKLVLWQNIVGKLKTLKKYLKQFWNVKNKLWHINPLLWINKYLKHPTEMILTSYFKLFSEFISNIFLINWIWIITFQTKMLMTPQFQIIFCLNQAHKKNV